MYWQSEELIMWNSKARPHSSLHSDPQILRSAISRRQLLRLLAAAGAYAAAPLSCRRTPRERELRFFGTGTLDVTEKHWHRLTSELGIVLKFIDNQNDPGPVIARMRKGNAATAYHLGGLQGGAERELAEAGLILPWDLEKIPNYNSLWSWARGIRYTQSNGKTYGIPTVINADSIIYLPAKIGSCDSYGVIFDKKLRGKVAMEDAWINSVIFTAIYLKENSLARITEPGNLTVDELGTVMEFLIKNKRDGQFRTFWSGWENGVQLIKAQEVWAMTGWEPIVYAAKEAGVDAAYAVPREGYEGWSNDVLLHKGAEADGLVEAAHEFVNWELAGYYGCALGELRGYLVPTDNNVRYAEGHPQEFNPEKQRELARHVRQKFEAMKGQIYWQNVRPNEHQLYNEWWERLRAA
jgi:putative spermidine/putrescine transport system substrate-binding protein